jgi:hypothetical protein
MNGTGVVCLSVFDMALIIALAFGSSETSIENTSVSPVSAQVKPFDPESMNMSMARGTG